MEGMVELAEEVFHMPVRLGMPQYSGGLSEVVGNPIYSTGVGLIEFGCRNRHLQLADKEGSKGFLALFEKIKSWFQGSF